MPHSRKQFHPIDGRHTPAVDRAPCGTLELLELRDKLVMRRLQGIQIPLAQGPSHGVMGRQPLPARNHFPIPSFLNLPIQFLHTLDAMGKAKKHHGEYDVRTNLGVGSAVIRPIDHAPDVMYFGGVEEKSSCPLSIHSGIASLRVSPLEAFYICLRFPVYLPAIFRLFVVLFQVV